MGPAAIYRATKKERDIFWNVYVCRPPAALLVYALAGSRVTPNQITLAAVIVAALAAVLLLTLPGYSGALLAILVFELSYVLDCADGMLARHRGTQSAAGHLLDFLMDELKAFIVLAAVAVRLFFQYQDPRFLLLGIVGLVALAAGIAMTTFMRRPEIVRPEVPGTASAAAAGAGTRAAGPPAAAHLVQATKPTSLLRRLFGLAEGGARYLVHYPSYILYAALLGHLEYYLLPYVAINSLYALRSFGVVSVRFGR